MAPRLSVALRLIDAGAVRIDGEAIGAGCYSLARSELGGRVIAVGRRHIAHLGR